MFGCYCRSERLIEYVLDNNYHPNRKKGHIVLFVALKFTTDLTIVINEELSSTMLVTLFRKVDKL